MVPPPLKPPLLRTMLLATKEPGATPSVQSPLTVLPSLFTTVLSGLTLLLIWSKPPVTVIAAASKLDASLEEAARSLGASPWRIFVDIVLPALAPGLIAAGAICFATAMGAFGTAFTLATDLNVLPMTIYTEFTLNANIATAAGLSIVLGIVTWAVLALARRFTGHTAAAAA